MANPYNPYDPINIPGALMPTDKPLSTEVGMIDTGSAISQVNKQNSYLKEVAPKQFEYAPGKFYDENAFNAMSVEDRRKLMGVETPVANKIEKPAVVPKATYTNANGQTFMYSQEELNDPLIQQQIKDGGMVLSEKDPGVNIYGDNATTNQTDTLQAGVDAGNKKIEDLTQDMLSWNVDNDPDFQAQAQSIRSQYEKMKREMEKVNYSRQQAYASAGMRGGTTQYAGDITRGIVGEEITQGSERISEISRQESDAISAARQAYKTGKWSDFNNIVNALKDIRDQKQTALTEYNKLLAEKTKEIQAEEKLFQKQKIQASRDSAVADLMNQGVEDVGAMLNLLNFDESGKQIGDFTAEEIAKSMNLMANKDALTGLDADYRTYSYLKNNQPDELEAMGITSYSGYLKSVKSMSAGGTAPSSYKEWELAGGEDGTGKSYAEFIGGQRGGLDNQTINQIDKVSASFDSSPIVKNYNDVLNKKLSVDSIIKGGVSGPRDLALVFDFMKALDPTSVVRESEYESAAKSGNIFTGIYAKFNGYLKEKGGILPPQVKSEFQAIIQNKYKSIESQYDNLRKEKARLIEKKTGEPGGADYLIDYKGEILQPETKTINGNTYEKAEGGWKLQSGKTKVGGDTNQAVKAISIGGKNIQVSNQIADKIAMADRDFFNATGKHLQVNQSYRTTEQQAKLYKELSAKGARVAPPGKSFHEKGLAIDVSNWKEAEKYLRKYGLKNNLSDDKGHFSYGEFT